MEKKDIKEYAEKIVNDLAESGCSGRDAIQILNAAGRMIREPVSIVMERQRRTALKEILRAVQDHSSTEE